MLKYKLESIKQSKDFQTMPKIDKSIFREYDIRGIADGTDLSPEIVELIGKAYGTFLSKHGKNRAVVGHDTRMTSESFSQAVIKGILSTGIDVFDLGMVTSPMMYWSQYYLDSEGGVMITASHNPPDWNGMKLALGRSYTLIGDELLAIRDYVESGDFKIGRGRFEKKDIFDAYKADILKRIHSKRKLRVVVDCANGAGGKSIPAIYRAAGFDVIEQYCDADGKFPYSAPDPSMLDFMESLGNRVVKEKADLGLGFDGDGDRLGMVDDKGEAIWPDRYMILLSRAVLLHNPGAKIIFDVKCSQALEEDIQAHGGIPIMWKTGHSHIKAKLHQENAPLAGEMSGHIFFGGDQYYGFDDSTFSGLKLLEYLSGDNRKASRIFAEAPYYVATPTIHVACADDVKYQVVEKLTRDFKDLEGKGDVLEVITINGARVRMRDGWGLVRPSSNLPVLVLRMEAKTKERLGEIKNYFRKMFEKYPEIAKEWDNE